MKLKYVLAMYPNISTSIHTHGLVPCTQDLFYIITLHNSIQSQENLQQIVSEPATNNVIPCNRVLYHHIKLQPMCIAFFPQLYNRHAAYYTTERVCM